MVFVGVLGLGETESGTSGTGVRDTVDSTVRGSEVGASTVSASVVNESMVGVLDLVGVGVDVEISVV